MGENFIHIEFKEPYNGITHMYFGSIKAIYSAMPYEVIGIRYNSLRSAMTNKVRYENTKVIIRRGEVVRMKQQKNKINFADYKEIY